MTDSGAASSPFPADRSGQVVFQKDRLEQSVPFQLTD
ncbi:hypothetical protein AVEN_191655-1 [Araneus ventricosus]|uniref:Uncharacterized protein n=1 Tax=Araneus ventricosus TaxID=182803 RepID=A0A4Y2E233_ARAVE|nr:hypothetical protein AVEN_191655-1 [Araneus ventricosus]